MRIGELGKRVGVDPKTVRYYESIGVLPRPPRTPSGARRYGDEDVERLRFVRRARQIGLRLDEIREILALRDRGRRPCDYVIKVASRRVAELDERIAEMDRARGELQRLLRRADRLDRGKGRWCELLEHSES